MSSLGKFFNIISTKNSVVPDDTKKTIRALPGSWYSSEEMYQLERRAVFSRRWLLVTHSCRLKEVGTWLQYDIGGYNIILVRDRTEKINGFHNVCRHRAYNIVEGDQGKALVFACRYHGWSYGLNGNLAKAPGYQELPDFDKSKNGLFSVHVHIDATGFIWVNLDGKETPEVAWEDYLKGCDTQSRYSAFNFDDYEYDHTWQIDANYNWKLGADNYNECYHCKTTHPDIPDVVDLSSYSVDTQLGWLHHNGSTERQVSQEQVDQGLQVTSSYFWPNISLNVSKNFMFSQRFVPKSPQKTQIIYEVYRSKHATDENFNMIDTLYKRVMNEDKVLCNAAQQNINKGVFINGELHPKLEKGPLFFQRLLREAVVEHFQREDAARQEVWPAKQAPPTTTEASQNDISFCSNLNCCKKQVITSGTSVNEIEITG